MRKGALCAMTLNSFRARFSDILEALEEAAEPALKIGSTSARQGTYKIKKGLVTNQILDTDTSPMHFFWSKKCCPNA